MPPVNKPAPRVTVQGRRLPRGPSPGGWGIGSPLALAGQGWDCFSPSAPLKPEQGSELRMCRLKTNGPGEVRGAGR